jgi:preprotein translocase subunit SecG
MSAPYGYINGTQAGSNVLYFFGYANTVTGGLFVLFFLIAFWLIILIGSLLMQMRFSGAEGMRFDKSFLAASFSSLGLALILEQVTGLLSATYFIVLVVLTVLSLLWVAMGTD